MKKTIILSTVLLFSVFSCTDKDDEFTENENQNKGQFETLKNGVTLQKFDDDTYVFQGDILLSKDDAESLVLFSTVPYVETRGTIAEKSSLHWSNGIIPYKFESNIPDALKTRTLDAMSEWERNTPIRFIERTNQSKYVNIELLPDDDEAAGYSTIGCSSKPNIKLSAGIIYQSVLHELGHTIGLVHEHERVDRDEHIIINRNAIIDDFKYAFDPNYAMRSPHPFDFRSIMIYSSTAFAISSSNRTITAFDGSDIWRIGTLSPLDIDVVNHIYNNVQYNSVLQPKGTVNSRVEYTITYPNTAKMGYNVVVTVKAKAITAPAIAIKEYTFSNPSNGTMVSSNNNVRTGNPKIKVQEFIFRPNRTGELKINCNESILANKFISINVVN
jgi:hypothetical protein